MFLYKLSSNAMKNTLILQVDMFKHVAVISTLLIVVTFIGIEAATEEQLMNIIPEIPPGMTQGQCLRINENLDAASDIFDDIEAKKNDLLTRACDLLDRICADIDSCEAALIAINNAC